MSKSVKHSAPEIVKANIGNCYLQNNLPGWGGGSWSSRIKDLGSVISISACSTIPLLPSHRRWPDRNSGFFKFSFRIWSFCRQSRTLHLRDDHSLVPVLLGSGAGQLLKLFCSSLLLGFLETIFTFYGEYQKRERVLKIKTLMKLSSFYNKKA